MFISFWGIIANDFIGFLILKRKYWNVLKSVFKFNDSLLTFKSIKLLITSFVGYLNSKFFVILSDLMHSKNMVLKWLDLIFLAHDFENIYLNSSIYSSLKVENPRDIAGNEKSS